MMNDCADGEMRDLLPGYVHRTLSSAERVAVVAHLESCEDCRAEVALITSASRAFPVADVDVARIVKALPAPPRRVARRTFAGQAQRIAAAIAIVALGAFTVVALRGKFQGTTHEVAKAAPPVAAGTELASAPPVQAARVAVDSPASTLPPAPAPVAASRRPSMSFGGGLSDLSDDQLDALMAELDDLDALPSAEPETHLTPILPPDGGHGAP
jgi:predicted anti-sigma-YlaC factor YlaD